LHPSVLVTESTFGLPIFRFLSRDEAAARIVGIARQAIDAGETPVFLAWSLGKAQEIATMLGQADVAVVLHGAAWRACGIYEAHGFLFPRAAPYQGRPTAASALIAPPEMRLNPMVTRIPKRRLAWVSGWARLQSQRTQMDCDELVPLSDHADFRALVEFCDALAPETVVVTHGFAEAFAHLLVGRGYRASALAGSIAEAPAMGAAGAGEARSPPGAAAEANGILAFEEGEH
jgi:putative mRNA 3-end processing factor